MASYDVTLEAHKAWEVWSVEIPDSIPEDEREQYVRDNFGQLDPVFQEAGNEGVEITDVEDMSDYRS